MSPVLFLYVMQAFLETLQIKSQPVQFSYFPENKNGNLHTSKGRLLSQNTKAKGLSFDFNSSFYVDDSFFCFQTRHELHQATEDLNAHFARFGLIMHIGSDTSKSKSEAMFFPSSLKQAKLEVMDHIFPEDLALSNGKKYTLSTKIKYLGSIITPLLNEDMEIEARIKKAKSMMGVAKSFFDNKDVDKRIKCQIYMAGPLNALLWGCETWNLTKRNLNRLSSFHHGAIRRILAISWREVREKEENSLPKKNLAAWISGSRKNGAPQLTCNNNFAEVISKILPSDKSLTSKTAPLREWLPLAKDESNWQGYIDSYFEMCRKTDPIEDLSEYENNEDEAD
jgi:hypothetical protein